jgi:2-amino-4-hydroxy-6-hydroxymethyldihydropteridine diphosphokinase
MNKVYLLLGGNQQHPAKQLVIAKKLIEKTIGTVTRFSSIYSTAAWGNTKQSDFMNQVLIVHTHLTSNDLITATLQIEKKMGRIRTKKNAPRIIDIDVLFFSKQIIETPALQVPHPRLHLRRFALVPLNELSPNFKHPVLNKTIHHLLTVCTDDLAVHKI